MRRNAPRTTHRTRGEGYLEYVIVLSVVMICSIVGLMTAGSETMKSLQYASGICDTCPKPKKTSTGQGPGTPDAPAPEGATAPAPGDAASGPEEPPAPPTAPEDSATPPTADAGSGYASGALPGDPNAASSMGIFAKIWGWFTGMWA